MLRHTASSYNMGGARGPRHTFNLHGNLSHAAETGRNDLLLNPLEMMTVADLMIKNKCPPGSQPTPSMAGVVSSKDQRPSLLKRKESSAGLNRLQQAQVLAHQEAALVLHSHQNTPHSDNKLSGPDLNHRMSLNLRHNKSSANVLDKKDKVRSKSISLHRNASSANVFDKSQQENSSNFPANVLDENTIVNSDSRLSKIYPNLNTNLNLSIHRNSSSANVFDNTDLKTRLTFHRNLSSTNVFDKNMPSIADVRHLRKMDGDDTDGGSEDTDGGSEDDGSLDGEFGQLLRDLGNGVTRVEDGPLSADDDSDNDDEPLHEVAPATDVSKAAPTDDDTNPIVNKFVKLRMKNQNMIKRIARAHFFTKKVAVSPTPEPTKKLNRTWSLEGVDLTKVGLTDAQIKRRTTSETKFYFIHPHGELRQGWDMLSMLFILYNAIMIPFVSSFVGSPLQSVVYSERVVDIFFIIELVLNFFTGVEVEGKIEFNQLTIAKRYVKGWFWVDIVSAFPWFTVEDISLNYTRLFRLLRLLRLLRMFKLSRIMHRLEMALSIRSSVAGLSKFVFAAFGVMHWMSCIFFSISHSEAAGGEEDTWVTVQNLLDIDRTSFDQYVASLYWSVMTMTTVGYGDVAPRSTNERIFAVFAMLVGAIFFGYGISEVVNIVASLREKDTEFRRQMDTVNSYMKARDLPVELREEIREYFVQLQKSKEQDLEAEEAILDQLSAMLRSKVAFAINDHFLTSMPFFQGSDPSFLLDLALSMRMLYLPPFETVITEGEYGDTMYFIVRGAIEVSRNNEVLVVLGEKSYFGEMAVLNKSKMRTASVRTLCFCELRLLTRSELLAALRKTPNMRRQIMKMRQFGYSNDYQNVLVSAEGAGESPTRRMSLIDHLIESEPDIVHDLQQVDQG
jgi:hypothetical protein